MDDLKWQKVEGTVAMLAGLSLPVFIQGALPWWVWPVFLLLPDLSMLGYLAGPRIGAVVYNVAHLYGTGPVIAAIGLAFNAPIVIAGGCLWLAHVGIDRSWGYGLKRPTGFKDTHLGRIGR